MNTLEVLQAKVEFCEAKSELANYCLDFVRDRNMETVFKNLETYIKTHNNSTLPIGHDSAGNYITIDVRPICDIILAFVKIARDPGDTAGVKAYEALMNLTTDSPSSNVLSCSPIEAYEGYTYFIRLLNTCF